MKFYYSVKCQYLSISVNLVLQAGNISFKPFEFMKTVKKQNCCSKTKIETNFKFTELIRKNL